MIKLTYKTLAMGTLLLILIAGFLVAGNTTSAQQIGSNFNASRIIDDLLFYNGNQMTAAQIQQFLNARVPVCDTNGQQLHRSGQTRAQWAAANNRPLPPYLCLKDFVAASTPAKSDSGLCSPLIARTNRTAAQIIDDVARACNVSQKVLLVTLEKEQSLLSDTWPWPVQYEKAMGYFCPDDPTRPGWCAPEYAGFFNQVYNAARQLQRYRQQPNSFNHAIGRTSFVSFQASAPSCGGTNLTMLTAATAALYNYTPYQPNQAALNNLYGTGDACSAYGNRNFWRMYNDWFGSTQSIPILPILIGRYNQLGGVQTLGITIDFGFCNIDESTCWQQYEKGYIIYSKKNGAWESKGSIRKHWGTLGFQNGSIGYPKGPEVYAGNGLWWQQFENGFIIGSEKTGFWESMGRIRDRWGQLGFQNSSIGLPTGRLVKTSKAAYWQRYENGYIVSAPGDNSKAWESKGALRSHWAELGFQNGYAGWPTGPEVFDSSTLTWSQKYQKGTIFYREGLGPWFNPN
jgi:hypothetical protein